MSCPAVPGVQPQLSDEWLGLLAGRADTRFAEAEQRSRLMTLWHSTSLRKQAHVSPEDLLLCVLFFMLHDFFFLFKPAVNRGSEEEKARFYWLPRKPFLCFLF